MNCKFLKIGACILFACVICFAGKKYIDSSVMKTVNGRTNSSIIEAMEKDPRYQELLKNKVKGITNELATSDWDSDLYHLFGKCYVSKYAYVLNKKDEPSQTKNYENKYPNKIWTFWHCGEEEAPNVVKVCVKSMRKYSGDREVILLNDENVRDYINIPKYIWEKYRNGMIRAPHFSDIVRVTLLKEYGGVWLDATTLLTGKIPDNILNAPFFAPACVPEDFDCKWIHAKHFPYLLNNYCMSCNAPHNHYIECIHDLLLEYWKHEFGAPYCFFGYFSVLAIEIDEKCNDIICDMFKNCYYDEVKDHLPGRLSYECLQKFDNGKWEEMKKNHTVHKIFGASSMSKHQQYEPGTFGDMLVKGKL